MHKLFAESQIILMFIVFLLKHQRYFREDIEIFIVRQCQSVKVNPYNPQYRYFML